eukprot:GILK01002270.1.p1 GENE.GILK01002270.1~~GILK01002270.1.p1  ORF type:complete len:475 (-),score=74.65 GILK01002270.1:187-1569(-)
MAASVVCAVLAVAVFAACYGDIPAVHAAHIRTPVGSSTKHSLTPDDISLNAKYTGYLTVNRTVGANLFYWFIESERDPANDPLVLWLNGGPGSSSLIGLFYETGPYRIDEHVRLQQNLHSWTKMANMLYIDQPVGTGFSYVEKEEGYAVNEAMVVQHLYTALQQFFTLYPSLRRLPFYTFGESYAAKYLLNLATFIYQQNRQLLQRESVSALINLRGLGIGDGWVDPLAHVLSYPQVAYTNGLIGALEKSLADQLADKCKHIYASHNYAKAFEDCNKVIGFILQQSGLVSAYDLRRSQEYNFTRLSQFLNQSSVQPKLNVGSRTWKEDDDQVELHLEHEVMAPASQLLPLLLQHYKIMFYNGQFDLVCNTVAMDDILNGLNWSGKDDFLVAERQVWKQGERVAGYVREAGNLIQVTVRESGHLVPMDQPESMLNLLAYFIHGQPLAIQTLDQLVQKAEAT